MPKVEMRVYDCTPAQAVQIAQFIETLTGNDEAFSAAVQNFAQAPSAPPPPPVVVVHNAAPLAPPPPATVSPVTPPAASSTLVDKRGVPWHADYHAGSKGMNQDGSWKKKKGAPVDAVAAYEAQFAGNSNGGHTVSTNTGNPPPASTNAHVPPVAPPPPTPGMVQQQTGASGGGSPTAEQLNQQFAPHLPPQGAPLPPPPPVMAPPPPASFVPTYAQFYEKYVHLVNAGVMNDQESVRINQVAGVASPNQYATDDNARMLAWPEFTALEQRVAA